MPVGHADNLQASAQVGSQAAVGEHVELTGDANATGAASISSSATMLVAGRAVHSSSPSTPTIDGAVGPVIAPLPPFPPMTGLPVTLSGISVGIRLTNPTLLFPTVSPSSGPSAPLPSASHIQLGTTAVGLLPSGPSPMGAQEFGVAILAAAIAIGMVIPWLPRRTRPRGTGPKR
jgi:hypothetical protein